MELSRTTVGANIEGTEEGASQVGIVCCSSSKESWFLCDSLGEWRSVEWTLGVWVCVG